MEQIWSVLGLEPTKDVFAIRRAYAEQAKTCHPEEDPEGFLRLRQAYQAALAYAERSEAEKTLEREIETHPEDEAAPEEPPEEEGWSLPDGIADGTPNPYADGEAIRKFLDLYTGSQRKNPKLWMDYFASDAFLDAGWDPRFTALLLEKVTEAEQTFPPSREFMNWLNVVYQFSGAGSLGASAFDGMDSILRIAAKGPAPKEPKGNEFAMLQSFLDYRHLVRLAQAGRWNLEAIEGFRTVLNRYAPAYIRERCEQRVTPDCERHPAGLRVFIHFFRREDLPEAVYREAWQRLDLKNAIMGRAKALYGPLRELAIQRVPGIAGETPVNFLRLNQNLDAYLAQIKADPAGEEAASAAFFQNMELQKVLSIPRFVENQLLTYSKWRREEMGEGLLRRLLDYYRAHLEIPRAAEAVSGLEGDLRERMVKRWSQEDAQAESGAPASLAWRPFFRHWLNTAFYTARDPENGVPLLHYLEKYFPYQEEWSRRFAEDAAPWTGTAGSAAVEIVFHPLHMEYRVNGEPVYRPCLTWEQTAQESGDWFFLLLPITAAPSAFFDGAVQEIDRRLEDTAAPDEDRVWIARCLAGHVCRLPAEDCAGSLEALPLELSAEGGGRLYTAVWCEDGGPVTVFRQTSSGRGIQEEWEPEPGEDCLEAVRRRLAVLASPTYFDISRLRKLPRHICFTPNGGEEAELCHPELLGMQPEPLSNPAGDWEQTPEEYEEEDLPKLPSMVDGLTLKEEKEPVPPEKLVTKENLSALLARFAQGELERLEMEWSQGRLVLCRDGDKYACLYFENSFFRGEYWYSLLSDPEMYQTIDSDDVVYVPFGMGKLPEYSVHQSAQALLRDIDQVLGQMGWGPLEGGGRGGWMWSCNVNLQNARHKVRMAQQKLGGVPPCRGRNDLLAKFVPSRFPAELETIDLKGERTVTALKSGSYGLAAHALIQFMQEKLSRLRIAWTFQTPGGGTDDCYLVLLRDEGNFMMFWLQDGKKQALAYASDAPVRFMGRFFPACLVHRDLQRIRNCVDLLLDDIDNTEPIVNRPGEFVPLPYEKVRADLVKE